MDLKLIWCPTVYPCEASKIVIMIQYRNLSMPCSLLYLHIIIVYRLPQIQPPSFNFQPVCKDFSYFLENLLPTGFASLFLPLVRSNPIPISMTIEVMVGSC
uniref:Uncharacterized protein n=1 Tax=Cacopsylla melanoneura TaxID=428564 RepID=A0A8D9E8G5_9HEMI